MKNYIDKDSEIYSYDDDISKEFLDLKIKDLDLTPITDEDLAELRKPTLENLTNQIKSSLMDLCDKKQNEAQRLVLGYKATPMQLERYKDKYERAKSGQFDQALNDLIILKHEQYLTAIRNFVDLIEYFRSAVDDLIIAEQLDKANEVIAAAESFGANTTLEDIQRLLA